MSSWLRIAAPSAVALSLLASQNSLAQTASRVFTPTDLNQLARVSDPQTSPDGRYVAYSQRDADLEANRGRSDLWLVDTQQSVPKPRRLTQNPANDTSPRWSANGIFLYFLSARGGTTQIWRLPLAGGEAVQITDLPLDVTTFKLAAKGTGIAMTMDVFPDCSDLKCSRERFDGGGKNKSSARKYDSLFIRHWDEWRDGSRSHLFVAPFNADGRAGAPVDVSKALDADIPSKPNGGDEEYTFSPDGKQVVFSARAAGREEPWSTNFDLYQVAADGSGKPVNLTGDNPAWDTQPVFLANGDLAWLAMKRPGFEADRFGIRISHNGIKRDIAADWDRSVGHLDVAHDGRTLLASADDVGQGVLFSVDPATGHTAKLSGPGDVAEFSPGPKGSAVVWHDLANPPDVYLLSARSAPRRLTSVNAAVLGARDFGAFEQFSFKGWNDETVHGYVVKPAAFDAGKKYPVAFIVHGGPQVAFANAWSWRWNAQVYAAHGYGVVFIDFHGSPGYGQAFTDSISQHWGDRPFEDLQKGLAAATGKYSWLDGARACSLGASYGGYMQNWIAGNWPDRFRCIVNHDGIFDTRSMYYTTEELWFTEWENGGPYYAAPENHERFNPANYVTKWKTPMLVIHGEQDFRVPDTQGIATFTALQRRGIESKLMIFPNENHWVLKPANSIDWYSTVLDWLDVHTRP